MVGAAQWLLLASVSASFWTLITASPVVQHVFDLSHQSPQTGNPRKLRGKFLHITDIHPDPFYEQGTNPDGNHPCHRGKGRAGYFGAEKTECDTPSSLVNATFDWIKEHIRDEIDFVVWTGDSARHDNDERYPRTNKQVESLNEFVVSKFVEVFGKPDNENDPDPTNDFVVPIVPTYGNNDILPHNIFQPGPNQWTKKYLTIWNKFVPQEQRHAFARGGYFYTEVIPNKLAVFSLNTLYFFESNGAVDGCNDHQEPGYEHFEWLRVQLEFLRQRNMKAILIGHVPPARTESKQNWDESCYQKYTLWLRQYRDVIVGNIFGHMNLDHFVLQDVKELKYKFKIDDLHQDLDHRDMSPFGSPDDFTAAGKPDYLSDLREMWGNLPAPPKGTSYESADLHMVDATKNKKGKHKKKKLDKFLKDIGGPYGERFSLSLISPSVVPNFYPTLRIIKYNTTGLEHDHPALSPNTPLFKDSLVPDGPQTPVETEEDVRLELRTSDGEDNVEASKKKKHKKKKKKGKKPKPNFPVPRSPAKTAPPGPAYSPQTFSFISWRQLYANLTKINHAVANDYALALQNGSLDAQGHNQKPILKKHFKFEQEYHTKDDKVYHMKDLTMRSWLSLAEKIGRASYKPLEFDIGGDNTTILDDGDDDNITRDSGIESDDEYPEDDAHISNKKKKKHHKGKKRKHQSLKKNDLWHAFVKRAFVGSKTDKELEGEFG